MRPAEYKNLIQQFLDGSVDVEEFARRYDKIFLSESGGMTKELFIILEDLWEDIDAYSPLWEPEDIDEAHITEETLREEAIDALEKINHYLGKHPD